MELYDVTLHHAGNRLSTIRKRRVTVAEIAVLRLIHGDDAVNDITPIGSDRRPMQFEWQRLREVYKVQNGDDPHPVDILWPGVNRALPESLREIGIGENSPFIGTPRPSVPDEDKVANFHAGWQDGPDLVQADPPMDDIDAILAHPEPGTHKAA